MIALFDLSETYNCSCSLFGLERSILLSLEAASSCAAPPGVASSFAAPLGTAPPWAAPSGAAAPRTASFEAASSCAAPLGAVFLRAAPPWGSFNFWSSSALGCSFWGCCGTCCSLWGDSSLGCSSRSSFTLSCSSWGHGLRLSGLLLTSWAASLRMVIVSSCEYFLPSKLRQICLLISPIILSVCQLKCCPPVGARIHSIPLLPAH